MNKQIGHKANNALIGFIGVMTGASAQSITQAIEYGELAGNITILVTGILAITLIHIILQNPKHQKQVSGNPQ